MSEGRFTVAQYCEQAERLLAGLHPDHAEAALLKARALAPDDTTVMDMLAGVQLELGKVEEAEKLVLESIRLQPDVGSSKYLTLAQLRGARDALACLERGIALLRAELDGAGDDTSRSVVGARIASALCSVAELFMTDLCMEEEAEGRCEAVLAEATALAPRNAEVLQTTASMRISQQRLDDANACMSTALEVMRALEEADSSQLPPYNFRVMTGKYLMELGRDAEAVLVFDRLLLEDDSDMEVWFHICLAYRLAGFAEESREFAGRALELIAEKEQRGQADEETPVQRAHFEKLQQEAEAAEAAAPKPTGMAEEDGGDSEGGSDDEDDR